MIFKMRMFWISDFCPDRNDYDYSLNQQRKHNIHYHSEEQEWHHRLAAQQLALSSWVTVPPRKGKGVNLVSLPKRKFSFPLAYCSTYVQVRKIYTQF